MNNRITIVPLYITCFLIYYIQGTQASYYRFGVYDEY